MAAKATAKKKTTRKKGAASSTKKKALRKKSAGKTAKKAVKKKAAKKKPAGKKTAKKTAKKKAAGRAAKKSAGEKGSKKAASKKSVARKTARKVTRKKGAGTSSRKTTARAGKRTVRKKVVRRRRNPRQFTKIRNALLAQKANLTQTYAASKGASMATSTDGTEDYIDYAVSSYTKEFMLSLSELDRKQIGKIEEAIARIDRGEYGLCSHCGEEIAIKRLEVAPWAILCIRCQEMEEKGLLQEVPSIDYDEEEEAEVFPLVLGEDVADESPSEDPGETEEEVEDDD